MLNWFIQKIFGTKNERDLKKLQPFAAAVNELESRIRELDDAQSSALLAEIAGDKAPGWEGPPASFAFFVLRSDACDVVYGTEAGFASLGIPYMAHIAPAQAW